MDEPENRRWKKWMFIPLLAGMAGFAEVAWNLSENRSALQALADKQKDLARAGWTLNWSTVTPRWAVLATVMDIRDVRVSGRAGSYRVLYGCDRITVRTSWFQPGRMRLTFGAPQAFAISDGSSPSAPVLFAMRLSSSKESLSVIAPGGRPEDSGKAVLSVPDAIVEVEVSPIRFGSVVAPFALRLANLHSVIVSGVAGESQRTMTTDTTLSGVTLPFAVAGFGNQVTDLRGAVSASGVFRDFNDSAAANGSTTVILHMGQARFGPLSATLAGHLVHDGQSNGDFDLTLHGLDRTAAHLADAGVIAPSVAQIAQVLGEAVDRAEQGKPLRKNAGGEEYYANAQSDGDSSATLMLPLRLRSGFWTLGNMPLEAAGSLLSGSTRAVP
ncbi:DUF2125 domain-containing protein [Acetobacter fallax]|uniref:DUF2125 domain-containing protein n=1 Tax=Acetobacter fallax TaxID=1737473 RepID=A0ABX0KDV3_9PROT|nr:DUF2125 domain-containing protein [Acetobacter fallax]NHO33088.1 DUF2125 domain-containing protein [Acetobacter fallax]NHO36666.1 DUF2125 domain-containing protein [Acetobacter fallax]